MNETVRKSVRIHLRFIMTKVINRKTSCFLFHSTEEVIDDAQDPFEKVDSINTYGSYNRTFKGDCWTLLVMQGRECELTQN